MSVGPDPVGTYLRTNAAMMEFAASYARSAVAGRSQPRTFPAAGENGSSYEAQIKAFAHEDPLDSAEPLRLLDRDQSGNANPSHNLIAGPTTPTATVAEPLPLASETRLLSTPGSYQEAEVIISEHGDRHVDDSAGARLEILQNLPAPETIGGPFYGITPHYIYRAYPLPNGDLNVGTYYDR